MNIYIPPKTPESRSNSITSRLERPKVFHRKQSNSISDTSEVLQFVPKPTRANFHKKKSKLIPGSVQQRSALEKEPKKPLKYQAEDNFITEASKLTVKKIIELKKNLSYSLKGCLLYTSDAADE